MDQVEPLAPRYLRVGVAERVDSGGRVRRELDVEGLRPPGRVPEVGGGGVGGDLFPLFIPES